MRLLPPAPGCAQVVSADDLRLFRATRSVSIGILLAAFFVMWPTEAVANIGLPMVALYLPPAWFALLPIVAVEWLYGVKRLGFPARRALLSQITANCLSTLIGLPLTWVVLAIVEVGLMERGASLPPMLLSPLGLIFGTAWLLPGAERSLWIVPYAVVVLTAIFYLMSVLSEYIVVARFFSNVPTRAIRRWMIRGNALSYSLLATLVLGAWLLPRVADPVLNAAMPITQPLVEVVFRVGGSLSTSPDTEDPPLIRAAAAGDVLGLRALISSGANVNEAGPHGDTALHSAVRGGHEEATQVLLDAGANIYARHNVGYQPIHTAAQYGNVATVKALLAAGAGANDRLEDGWTPLMVAVVTGQAAIIETLLDAGADVNARSSSGWTALKEARYRNETAIVNRLLRAGAIDYADGSR